MNAKSNSYFVEGEGSREKLVEQNFSRVSLPMTLAGVSLSLEIVEREARRALVYDARH